MCIDFADDLLCDHYFALCMHYARYIPAQVDISQIIVDLLLAPTKYIKMRDVSGYLAEQKRQASADDAETWNEIEEFYNKK